MMRKVHTMNEIAVNNATAHCFGQVVDRAQTEMPEWYLRSAREVLIVARGMPATSRHRPGTFHAIGWSRGASGFKKASRDGKSVLWVQPCGKFWIIERCVHLDSPGFRIRRAANLDAHTASCDAACGALRSDAAGAGRGIL